MYVQITTEAGFLSLAAVTFLFVLIGVCPHIVLAVLVQLDRNRAEKRATL
jgi:hypothetical protein